MARISPSTLAAATVWPPDDTEESVMGTSRHQLTITNVRLGVNEAAHVAAGPGRPPLWEALSQTMLLGLTRPDGSPYTTLPDVFAYKRQIDPDRGSVSLAREGPPLLVIEVASESTYKSDLDLARGKGWTYAHGGVREYLVLDPTGRFVREMARGWRLHNGVYRPWEPDARGHWRSEELPLAIGVEEEWVTVYDEQGERFLREGENALTLARKDAELAELRRRLAQHEG